MSKFNQKAEIDRREKRKKNFKKERKGKKRKWKKNLTICCLKEICFTSEDKHRLKGKGEKKYDM